MTLDSQNSTSQRLVTMARKVYFSCAHRYVSKQFTDQQNRETFGPCYNPYGHGHDYILEAFFSGFIDPVSGLIVNLSDIDVILKEIVAPLDHRHLNHEIPYFADIVPTTENIAAYLFHLIEDSVKHMPLTLSKVRLFENPDLWVDYGPDRSLGL